jgi:hypothetical protein
MTTVAGGGGKGASLDAEGGDKAMGDSGPAEEVGASEHNDALPGKCGPVGAERVGDVQGKGGPGEGGRAGDGGQGRLAGGDRGLGGLAGGDGGASRCGAAACPLH